jgi:hypothetical protein
MPPIQKSLFPSHISEFYPLSNAIRPRASLPSSRAGDRRDTGGLESVKATRRNHVQCQEDMAVLQAFGSSALDADHSIFSSGEYRQSGI